MLTAFDAALSGAATRLLRDDGVVIDLAVRRWRRTARGGDRWLLERCTGPAIDLGCGPGRLVTALAGRGVPALGVDVSALAQLQCRRRGAQMLRRDLFCPLPGEGTWQHVLLADGNIGIGGDPLRLLRRAGRLLRAGGTLLVETDPTPHLLWQGTARVADGAPLPWACAGADALCRLTATLGMHATDGYRGRRSFVQFAFSAAGPAVSRGA